MLHELHTDSSVLHILVELLGATLRPLELLLHRATVAQYFYS